MRTDKRMKSFLKSKRPLWLPILSVLSLAIFAMGCGESHTGYYTGSAKILDRCNNYGGTYQLDVRTIISGDSVSVTIVRAISKEGKQSLDIGSQARIKLSASGSLEDNTRIFVEDLGIEGTDRANINVTGDISPDRSQLDDFNYVFDGYVTEKSAEGQEFEKRCYVQVEALQPLVLKDTNN